jgi:predicted RND superfamily exporter protein
MGWLGVSLDIGTAMVAAVVLGIAVDDVVHLLDRFREKRDLGADVEAAMHDAVREVGQAVVSTSLALAVGFGALALSPWASVAHFGLISAIAIVAALATDLLLVPALVGVGDPGRYASTAV